MSEAVLFGRDLFGDPIEQRGRGPLADNFYASPFSVLSAREGWWQERKRAWLSLGIQSEVGRGNLNSAIASSGNATEDRIAREKACNINNAPPLPGWAVNRVANMAPGGSVFDPVLCELCYRWFCPPGGQVVDPFAGGSVRGIVAHMLGFKYWVRVEQIEANDQQAAEITPDSKPTWICGDALDEVPQAPEADFIFSCPPYGDLEKYSDDPRDLSNMEYHTFLAAYKRIIMRACKQLKNNRFACFVVGDFRDKKTGNYRNFVGDTTAAFIEQGLGLYNEAILVTAVGSLPIRIERQFNAGRKLGKTHQNVLVFVKGSGKEAAHAIAE